MIIIYDSIYFNKYEKYIISSYIESYICVMLKKGAQQNFSKTKWTLKNGCFEYLSFFRFHRDWESVNVYGVFHAESTMTSISLNTAEIS